MFVPKLYKAPSAAAVKEFIKKYDFATVISTGGDFPIATHIPLMYDEPSNTLIGHISIANEQKDAFANKAPILSIFSQAHSYISSSWYQKLNVPTWNYIAVHVNGIGRILSDQELLDHLKSLTNLYEAGRENAFTVEAMPEKMLDAHLKGVIGIAIDVTEVQASFKLSQNRNDQDYEQIISELRALGDQFSNEIADEMAKLRE